MRIVDSSNKIEEQTILVPVIGENDQVTQEEKIIQVEKVLESKEPRFKTMTYDELNELAQYLDIELEQENSVSKYEELFRQGLLFITQQECINGISGEEGKGMYFTEASDWEIVPEEPILTL